MSEPPVPSNRPLWLAIIVIGAVLVAGGCAIVFWSAKADQVTTLSAAGAAFVATVTLSLAAWKFLSD